MTRIERAGSWSLIVSTLGVLMLSACVSMRAGGPTARARAHTGLVAADHPLAAEAGAQMLRLGGNAVDAAVATSFALSVVRSDACGIGGGGFMLIHLNDDPRHGTTTVALNYRETSPAGVGRETYAELDDPEASQRGGMAVAVPGTVAGLLHSLETYGTLDRATVLEPAIALAEGGFDADAHHVRTARSLSDRFRRDARWRDRFPLVWDRLTARGTIEIGESITLPGQARALRLIAEHGADAFYRGEIADAIVASVTADGGVLTHEDLAGYAIRVVEPVSYELESHRVLSMPPPSSGGVAVVQILSLAERLDLTVPVTGWLEAADAHLLAESMKHAFADRSRHMADSAFTDVPVGQMLDDAELERVSRSIELNSVRDASSYGAIPVLPEDGGTSHISVIDARGNAVACTETINLAFGSLVGVRGFGFCLNDQMDDFTTIAGEANAFGLIQSDDNLPEPGKRPLSSMSPTIILDDHGEVVAVAGASGGPRIITSTAQALLRVLRGAATAAEAVAAPRIHHQWLPDAIFIETWDGVGPSTRLEDGLAKRGHALRARTDIGAVQLIRRDPQTGALDGAADPRKGGGVAGG